MKSIRLVLLSFFVLCSILAHGQDFLGDWVGNLKVQIDGKEVKLPCTFFIKTFENGKYKGQCVLAREVGGKKYLIETNIEGHESLGAFEFTDKEILLSNQPDNSRPFWCKKYGTLQIRTTAQGKKVITGNVDGKVQGASCMPAISECFKM